MGGVRTAECTSSALTNGKLADHRFGGILRLRHPARMTTPLVRRKRRLGLREHRHRHARQFTVKSPQPGGFPSHDPSGHSAVLSSHET
jgi:hypothetical protein